MPKPTIDLIALGKTFCVLDAEGQSKTISALIDITWSFFPGEVCLLVGSNGSGKTTLLRLMAGSLIPSSGHIQILGKLYHPQRWPSVNIAWIGAEGRGFYGPLNAYENLNFFAQLYGIPEKTCRPRIKTYLEILGLLEKADFPFQTYSHGQRTRLAIVRALVIDSPILLLDEPTEGLDPETRVRLWEILRGESAKAEQKTVIVATHDVSQALPYSDRILALQKGRLIPSSL